MDGLTLVHTHGGGQGRAVISADSKELDAGRAVFWWLIAVALMVALMMLIGAITRLTESGLSMVEWLPDRIGDYDPYNFFTPERAQFCSDAPPNSKSRPQTHGR